MTCEICGNPSGEHDYCSWACHVEQAKRAGGKVYAPNGLPIRVLRYDWTMLEHEHADHPDYKFPVHVMYVGKDPDYEEWEKKEVHGLIYCDGYVAVTLYEHCYAMFHVNDGLVDGGTLWKKDDWKITEASLKEIGERFPHRA